MWTSRQAAARLPGERERSEPGSSDPLAECAAARGAFLVEQHRDRSGSHFALRDEEQARAPAAAEVGAVVAVEEGDVAVELRPRRGGFLGVTDRRGAGLVLDEVAPVVRGVFEHRVGLQPALLQTERGAVELLE